MVHRKVLAGALATLALGACGPRGLGAAALDRSDISTLPPHELMSAAAVKTANVDSLRFTMTMGLDGADPSAFDVSGTGVVDVANKRGSMTIQMSGDVALVSDAASEMVFEESRVYMKLPDAASGLFPGAKPWIMIDATGLGGSAAMGAFGPISGDPTDGLQSLEMLDNVEPVATEAVRGVTTTHYRGEFSFDGLLGNPFAGLGGGMSPDMGELGPLMLDAWVDDQGLVRRFEVAMPLPDLFSELDLEGSGPSGPQTFRVTLELYDFGAPVQVRVPSESEVTHFNDLLQNMDMPDLGSFGA